MHKYIQKLIRVLAFGAMVLTGTGNALAIGGGGGSPWDDGDVCKSGSVRQVTVRAGSSIDNIRFDYGGSWAPPHGGSGGDEHKFSLDVRAGEGIVEIRHRSGGRVDQLTFITNKGRTFGPYGVQGGTPEVIKAPAGQTLNCVSGRAGDRVDQLNFKWGVYAPGPVCPGVGVCGSGATCYAEKAFASDRPTGTYSCSCGLGKIPAPGQSCPVP